MSLQFFNDYVATPFCLVSTGLQCKTKTSWVPVSKMSKGIASPVHC